MPFAMEDLADYGTYKAALKRELLKVGKTKAKFHYFAQYEFSDVKKPLMLVGVVPVPMLKAVAPKTKGLAAGHCTREGGTLALVVTKGEVSEKRLEKTMTDATFTETVTVHTLAEEDELVRLKMKKERDDELEKLRKGTKVKDGKLENEALLGGTLEALHHSGWQEANARKTLIGMEQETNRKKKEDGNDRLAHAVSGHGPDTDQIPRLISGRRFDEVMEEQASDSGPSTTVTLKDSTVLEDREVPEWTTTGKDPSPISSKFSSYKEMMLAVEDAFSVAMELQSRVAEEEKRTSVIRWKQVVAVPKINNELKMLVLLRDALDDAIQDASLITEETPEQEALALTQAVTDLNKECDTAQKSYIALREEAEEQRNAAMLAATEQNKARHAFVEALEAVRLAQQAVDKDTTADVALTEALTDRKGELDLARDAFHEKREAYTLALAQFKTTWGDAAELPAVDETQIGSGRIGRTVSPGVRTGESMSIPESLAIKGSGTPLTTDEMQERFENIKHKPGLDQATVILDPSEGGGWDVQTAFPVSGDPTARTVTGKEFAKMRAEERHQKANRDQLEAERVLQDQKEQEKLAIAERKRLENLVGNLENQVIDDVSLQGALDQATLDWAAAKKNVKEVQELVGVLAQEVKEAKERTKEAKKKLDEATLALGG